MDVWDSQCKGLSMPTIQLPRRNRWIRESPDLPRRRRERRAAVTAGTFNRPEKEKMVGENCELLNAPRSTRMSHAESVRIVCFSIRRVHESKNDYFDSGSVLYCRGSGLRQRRKYGHLEAERGQVEVRPWGIEEQLSCVRGRG